MKDRIQLIKGDITQIKADAIVNAANHSLLGGGGVDGAIHRAAGPGLAEVCRLLNGCDTGEAKITAGFKLPAKYIIHTVGPVWHEGKTGEEKQLASCYRESLKLATSHDCTTVAFPNISTGVYHFPKDIAAMTSIKEVRQYLEEHEVPEKVIFVCFDEENFEHYRKILEA